MLALLIPEYMTHKTAPALQLQRTSAAPITGTPITYLGTRSRTADRMLHMQRLLRRLCTARDQIAPK